ncbi:type II secretion system F family protein [Propionibacteriaceae bacterium G1746]|uniref:type II secretion system F family protein n=1 Tax=Aestuariimicrobium sp. G57 TaxID=3418485 RepID=UPI003C1DF94F
MSAPFIAAVAAFMLVLLAWPARNGRQLLRAPDSGATGVRWGPTSGRRLGFAVVPAIAVVALVPGPWAVVGGVVVATVAFVALDRFEDAAVVRRRQRLADQLVEALELLAGALASGSPVRSAIAEVAAVSPPETAEVLGLVTSHIRVGRSERDAWLALAGDPVVGPVWGRAARDLARNAETGAAVVQVLRVHAGEAVAVRRGQVEKQAKTVGVQSVLPLVCCFLPAFVLVGVVPVIAGLVRAYLP